LERLIELLFKYRPALFRQGELAFAAPPALAMVALLAALLLVPVLLRYRRVQAEGWLRYTLLGLRSAALALLVFCLLQPSLVLSSVVPQQAFVGVLADDSLSMRVADGAAGPRSAELVSALAVDGGSWRQRLEERFRVRLFGFSRTARRIAGPGELGFDGRHTRLDRALGTALEELQAVPLSGLVLFTDGAQTDQEGLADVLLELRARKVPVYPVALGSERYPRDVEVSRVEAPERVLVGSALSVDVTVRQTGFSGETASLEVDDEGRIVAVQEVRFPTSGEAAVVPVVFTAGEAGPRRFRFRVAPRSGEMLAENNQRHALIEVEDRRDKLLYFEGEPRYEVKFIRRAVDEDENLQLVAMVRLAENHFYRFGLDSGEELASGFPATREELFQYRGLVLGSIEASFFTYDQMRMILDFVSERGGGLLLLGGRRAFAEGGYAGTPIAELMPLELQEPAVDDDGPTYFARFQVRPTTLGANHPATQLVPPGVDPEQFWSALPPLSTLNPLERVKPGASTLLVGEGGDLDGTQVVLAHQRYGRGRVLALTVQDDWLWQMQAPLEDRTHETLWRQLSRWLVSYVPDPLELRADRSRVQPGEPVVLRAEVRDDAFRTVNSARVEVEVRAPSGEETVLPLEWTVHEDGIFEASFVPNEPGLYRLEGRAEADGVELGDAVAYFEATPLDDELYASERRTELLERIAAETGGRVFEPDRLDALLDELAYADSGATVREYRDLWDMPAIYLLLVGLLGSEWALRRWKGLS
jgi:uncharacterized membrane protein